MTLPVEDLPPEPLGRHHVGVVVVVGTDGELGRIVGVIHGLDHVALGLESQPGDAVSVYRNSRSGNRGTAAFRPSSSMATVASHPLMVWCVRVESMAIRAVPLAPHPSTSVSAEKRCEFRNVAQGVPEIVMTPEAGIVVVRVWPARIVCTAPTAPGWAAVEKLT